MGQAGIAQHVWDYLWNQTSVLLIIVDSQGHVLEANRGATELLDLSVCGSLLTDYVVDFTGTFQLEELVASGERRLVHLATPAGAMESFQIVCLAQEDRVVVLGTPDAERSGSLRTEIIALNNELASFARELSKKNAALAELNELKNRFLSMAAHDLRKPVGAILTYSEFLLDEAAPRWTPEQQQFLAVIRSASQLMAQLIDDFLDVAMIESGRLQLNRAWVDPAAIVAASVAVGGVHARKKQICCEVRASGPLPKAKLDGSKIEQVLINLLVNAIDHSPPGTQVTIACTADDAMLEISVQDQGVGIPAAKLQQLLGPSDEGRRTKLLTAGRTGIGLVIAQKIVEEHGGTLTAQSQLDRGSTFIVRLPVSGNEGDRGPGDSSGESAR